MKKQPELNHVTLIIVFIIDLKNTDHGKDDKFSQLG